MADAELLAVCLGAGHGGTTALDLARGLLDRYGGLSSVLYAAPRRLLAESGLGVAKAAALKACIALTGRCDEERLSRGNVLDSSGVVLSYLRARLARREREVFGVLFLDTRHRLIVFEELFLGSIDRACVHPREVLKRSLQLNAAAVILAHNHPSGVAEPSASDLQLTRDLKDLLARIDVRLLDHVVVTPGHQVSLAERGLL